MGDEVYFFDTYAFFEIIRGNPNYDEYRNVRAITTIFNLAELNYNLKKQKGKKVADYYTDLYKSFLIGISVEDLKKAMDLKIKHKNLSIPDAIGYIVAQRCSVKFLTADDDFKEFKGVEFVKK